MTNGLSNFEVLKQKISTSPRQSRVGEVLIVDDEESFVLSLEEGLSVYRKYFNLRTAPNGAEAVKVLKLSPIDLVITDLSMPKMDGFELLAYMNRNYPKIPVILMTAYGTPKIEEIVSNMGIFRYLEKPLDINGIADNIFDALGIKTSSIPEEIQKTDTAYKTSATSAQRTSISVSDMQNKIALAKKAAGEESKAKAIAEMEEKSKATATFGSRTSLSASDLEKLRKEARAKQGIKAKDHVEKKSTIDVEKQITEAAEKRAVLEAKAKAEAERFAREEAERKVKEAEERAKQEALAREEAQRKAKEAEERAKQETLAREEAIKKAKAEAEEKARQEAQTREEAQRKAKEAEDKAKQEAQAREEAIKKEKAEAEEKARQEAELKAKEAQTKVADKSQKDLKKETQQKLSAWKKG